MTTRRWLGVYVETDEDEDALIALLQSARGPLKIPTLDWDQFTPCEDEMDELDELLARCFDNMKKGLVVN